MLILYLFLKGAIFGLLIAAPVGPIGIMCIQRTMQYGWISGLIVGLGAALADTFYGAVAGFGIVLISDFILAYQLWFKIAGGCILLVIGLNLLLNKNKEIQENNQDTTHNVRNNAKIHSFSAKYADFMTSFMITFTNPGTIIAFIAIFATFGMTGYADKPILGSVLVLGVFTGAFLWWAGLSYIVQCYKHKIGRRLYHNINKVSASLIIAFSGLAFLSLLF